MTSYERAIGIGKSQDIAIVAAGKKRKKHKLNEDEERCSEKCARKHRDAKIASVRKGSSCTCDCETTLHDPETSCKNSQRRCRGWFLSSWPQTNDTPRRTSSNTDQSLPYFTEALARHASLQLVELRLECSSAAKWSEHNRSRREDTDELLSSPAGVLWRGNVKPLILPSQATSVGKIYFLLLGLSNFCIRMPHRIDPSIYPHDVW